MYKHILVPTDGSALSQKAIRTAALMARAMNGRVTGIYVIPPYTPPVYGEAVMYVPELSPRRYKEISEREAKKALTAVTLEADSAGVSAKTIFVTAQNPWEGIIRGAHAKKCDLIVMASHGRKGLAGLLLGSETTKVLTHSKIPVLVCR
jgi:nucleotide-binding universal stress UspA family protein